MNKNAIIGVVALVLIAGGVLVATSSSGDDTGSVANNTSNNQSSSNGSSSGGGDSTASSARFVDYSEATLASTKDTQRVLFFHATWCSTCKAFERQIESEGVPEGITVIKANYDTDTALRQMYDVNLQSTFVWLDENDQALQSWPFGSGLQGDIQNLYDAVI